MSTSFHRHPMSCLISFPCV
ncbi:hypothetical protein F383_03821 [Gossypium arboreum]|uniref:Uncharacterized protein n=1 Tax=Gossypium arboreum TaxID=29729 RepID=A0A0B0NBH3_GOSAR|nr:hypothetical protein F383_03821 [Gossypium arboreum]